MVRFGRRGKRHPKKEPDIAPATVNAAQPSQAAVDALSETLDEVFTSEDGVDDLDNSSADTIDHTDDDTTQQLLTSLGRFQRVLKGARAGGGFGPWSDECMHQLIHSAELALSEGWGDLVTTLSDTGRILQSYEDAGKADLALDFLDEAYEVLCLMVGDLIVDNVRDTVRDRWGEVYKSGLVKLEGNGIALVDDDVDGAPEQSADDEGQGDEMPFEMPIANEAIQSDDGLPTLDELPPLESLLTMNKGMVAQTTLDEGAPSDVEAESVPEEDIELLKAFADEPVKEDVVDEGLAPLTETGEAQNESGGDHGPSRIVVDIMDRICDELGNLESLSAAARPVGLETVVGGITALRQCTHGAHQEELDVLCNTMLAACKALDGREKELDDSFTELGFAFCGVYVEAMDDGMSENVQAWKKECVEWVDALQVVADSTESQEIEATLSEPVDKGPAAETKAVDTQNTEDKFQPYTQENIESAAPIEAVPEAAPESTDGGSGSVSNQLLESAQAAALKGDGAGAKVFALQAAVSIAKQEVTQAEESLKQAELKLKSSLESVDTARGKVSTAEESVKSATDLVSVGEDYLKDAKQESASVAEELEQFESGVAELNRQIQELQTERDAELEKVNDTITRQQAVQRKEEDAKAELQTLRGDENAERKNLEEDRQIVKDLQRQISDIETDMESARDRLTREKVSMADISQTIQHLVGGEPKEEPSEKDDGLLF